MTQMPTLSHLAIYCALASAAFTAGYHYHHYASPLRPDTKSSLPDESDEEETADVDLGSVQAGILEPCKLILVVRTDLKMTSGKIAAQCGHATLACYKVLSRLNPTLLRHWERTGQAKIAVRCDSEDQMMELEAIAKSLSLCAQVIQDAGRTQIAAGSHTVLGIGPGPTDLVNQVTGHLKLL